MWEDVQYNRIVFLIEGSPLLPGIMGNCGDTLGGPSISVGGDRKGRVSEGGRPSGDGPNGDLSPGGLPHVPCHTVYYFLIIVMGEKKKKSFIIVFYP